MTDCIQKNKNQTDIYGKKQHNQSQQYETNDTQFRFFAQIPKYQHNACQNHTIRSSLPPSLNFIVTSLLPSLMPQAIRARQKTAASRRAKFFFNRFIIFISFLLSLHPVISVFVPDENTFIKLPTMLFLPSDII